MFKLFPSLEFEQIESAVCYAARLAAVHTGAGLVPFLRDIGIQPMHLARGDRATILRLAEVADVDPDPVLVNTPLSLGNRSYNLRGHIVSSEFLISGNFDNPSLSINTVKMSEKQ